MDFLKNGEGLFFVISSNAAICGVPVFIFLINLLNIFDISP